MKNYQNDSQRVNVAKTLSYETKTNRKNKGIFQRSTMN